MLKHFLHTCRILNTIIIALITFILSIKDIYIFDTYFYPVNEFLLLLL